jgi:branched-chain amino acid transport system ATP-binding protein
MTAVTMRRSEMPVEATALSTRGLSMSFGGLHVLHDLDLDIRRGETRAIIGPNGAGKTTLFHILSGELKPSRGQVELFGENVTGLPTESLHDRGLSRSFQVTRIFPDLTVEENVSLACLANHPRRPGLLLRPRWMRGLSHEVEDLLASLDLTALAKRPAGTLSHGDQRRLDVALAMASNPAILLLDEPTAGMARNQAKGTMELLRELLQGRTIVLIEHDMDLVMRISDRVSMLHHGKLVATGTPEEIRKDPQVREAYLRGGRS